MADIIVNAGGDLQAAINSASAGDVIKLQSGATFTGNFTLPSKSGLVTITTNATLNNRDNVVRDLRNGVGRWIQPADEGTLARIVSPNTVSPITGDDTANWLIDGIKFLPNESVASSSTIISITGASNNVTVKRCMLIVPAYPAGKQKRFMIGNGTNIAMKNCYIKGVWWPGEDSQGFVAWDGAGPYNVSDNFIEAASENIMFGGADPSSEADIPGNITVEWNYCTKDRTNWFNAQEAITVKNLFELKACSSATVRNNLFEHNWSYDVPSAAQPGFAIVFTPVNQGATAPWVVVKNVLFEKNIIRHTALGFNITGFGYEYEPGSGGPTKQSNNIVIKNNDITVSTGRFFQIGAEIGVLNIEHNTCRNTTIGNGFAAILLLAEGQLWAFGEAQQRDTVYAVDTLHILNNMIHGCNYGVHSSVGFATVALTARVNTLYTFQKNVLAMDEVFGVYPAVTFHPTLSEYDAEFVAGNLLRNGSPYENLGTDGLDIGWAGPDVDGGGGEEPGEEDIVWTSLTGTASANGNDLQGGASSGALSVQSINEDCYVEWIVPDTDNEMFVGLGTDAAYDLMQSHAIEFGGSLAGVRELGIGLTEFPLVAGDSFRIQVNGTQVTYHRNGILQYTSLTPVTLPTKVDVGFFGGGGNLTDAILVTTEDPGPPDPPDPPPLEEEDRFPSYFLKFTVRNLKFAFTKSQRKEHVVQELQFARDPAEYSGVELDWSDELGGETITGVSSVTITPTANPPLVEDVDDREITSTKTVHWLSGGVPGTFTMKVKITTSGGRIIARSILIPVENL